MAKKEEKMVTEMENEIGIENDTALQTFKPEDYSDVGQARVLAAAYGHCLRDCEGIGWLIYQDGVWKASDTEAHGLSQKLTDLQLKEATEEYLQNLAKGARTHTEKDLYLKYVNGRRTTGKIAATLKEAKPMLHIETADLDADPLILNTPDGEAHLDTGEMHPHDPMHYITQMTSVAPSDEGAEMWAEFVDQIACSEEVVADFLQQFAGMAAVGKVYEERLVVAIGSGGNGKSTFFNALQDVLGDYAGTIRSELLIASNDSGKKFELACLRGKRFVVAEELEAGKQLDTAALKQICSTGDINAQFKGKDVFTFKPSHSTVLCTNHMPDVKTIDDGTWDRLTVVPFKARFRHQNTEIKNYAAYLVEHCGGAILKWVIEGAQKYIQNDYKLVIIDELQVYTNEYRVANDWAVDFFADSLVFGPRYSAYANELYDAYETYCQCAGIKALSRTIVMPRIAQHPDVKKRRTGKGWLYEGVGTNKPESLRILQKHVQQCREESCLVEFNGEWF